MRFFVGAQVIEPNGSNRPSVFKWLRGPFVVRGRLCRLENRGGRGQSQMDEARVSKSETKSDMVLFGWGDPCAWDRPAGSLHAETIRTGSR